MIIAMACTQNWYHYLTIDIYSLLKTTKSVKKIYLLLETDNIEEIPELEKIIKKYQVELEIINFNKIFDKLVEKNNINRDTKFSNLTFARLVLPSVIKEDKVLYIDTDAIVLKDISELWDIDISFYYIAGCQDYNIFKIDLYKNKEKVFNYKYINAGVMLMNLKAFRLYDIQSKSFELIKKIKFPLLDQDILNILCIERKYIPNIYNYFKDNNNQNIDKSEIKIIHYVGDKNPWIKDKEYSELWYDKEKEYYEEFNNK